MSPHSLLYRSTICHNERGMTLALVLVLVGILTVVGTTAVMLTTTDLLVGGNYKTSQLAFYNAEAGVQYTLASLPGALSSGTLSLRGLTLNENYTVVAPTGFTFTTPSGPTFTRVGNTRKYFFRITGRPNPSSSISSTIEVVFQRITFFPYGLFGDELVRLNQTHSSFPFGYYSYDSRLTPNPDPADYPSNSTGEADVGSNGEVSAYPYTYIDGDVVLGDDGAGTEAVFTNPAPALGDPTVTGQAGMDVERVPPDPLGANGGSLAATIAAVSTVNDNSGAGISGNTINLGSGQSLTLTAGNYYLESVTLDPGATLTIDTSGGEVNIYLVGKLEAKLGSVINFTGQPPDFTLYSNAMESLIFRHLGVFKGTIYAPFAKVEMKNRAVPTSVASVAFGLIWANTIDMFVDFPGGTFYFDTALQDKFLSNDVSMVSWKEIRN
jgi:hypothetical protein